MNPKYMFHCLSVLDIQITQESTLKLYMYENLNYFRRSISINEA